jgi:hypothetical protein
VRRRRPWLKVASTLWHRQTCLRACGMYRIAHFPQEKMCTTEAGRAHGCEKRSGWAESIFKQNGTDNCYGERCRRLKASWSTRRSTSSVVL